MIPCNIWVRDNLTKVDHVSCMTSELVQEAQMFLEHGAQNFLVNQGFQLKYQCILGNWNSHQLMRGTDLVRYIQPMVSFWYGQHKGSPKRKLWTSPVPMQNYQDLFPYFGISNTIARTQLQIFLWQIASRSLPLCAKMAYHVPLLKADCSLWALHQRQRIIFL